MDLLISLISILTIYLIKSKVLEGAREVTYEEVKSGDGGSGEITCVIGSNLYCKRVDRAYHLFLDMFNL